MIGVSVAKEKLKHAPPEAQEAFAGLYDRVMIADRAVQIASEAIADALAGKKPSLPDAPVGGDAKEWQTYLIMKSAGALVQEAG